MIKELLWKFHCKGWISFKTYKILKRILTGE